MKPLTLLLLLAATRAHADAISPFAGECPPGFRKTIGGHAEICSPNPCHADSECGSGAHCVTLHVCRAMRELPRSGWGMGQPPQQGMVEIGMSQDGRCNEGTPATRQQCEPIEATPAFDRNTHRWTGQPYVSSSRGGCAFAPAPASAWLAMALGVLLWRRR